jgi:hypothetical protein
MINKIYTVRCNYFACRRPRIKINNSLPFATMSLFRSRRGFSISSFERKSLYCTYLSRLLDQRKAGVARSIIVEPRDRKNVQKTHNKREVPLQRYRSTHAIYSFSRQKTGESSRCKTEEGQTTQFGRMGHPTKYKYCAERDC